jgi:protein ImuB
MLLLRERLERLRLPAPVLHVQLDAPRMLAFEAGQEALFDDDPGAREAPVTPLLERLQARLGREAVRGLRGVEDHRPEYSWASGEPARAARCTPLPHRPVWLLPKPRRCRIDEYRLLAGPERIESGWWDGRDQRRDYFVVQDARGGLWWAYRAYKPAEGWYLHGVFA